MNSIIKTLFYEWKKKKLPIIIDREVDLHKYVDTKPNKIIVMTGFRRVGKTYLVFQLIKDLLKKKSKEDLPYFNFEDERIPLRSSVLTNLYPKLEEVGEKPDFLFLDEIQNMPKWSKWLRRIYDNRDVRIFVTGSSSKMSSKEIPTELRGRFTEIKLWPLSFKEFLSLRI